VPSLSINSLQFEAKEASPEVCRLNATHLHKKFSMPEVDSVLEINMTVEGSRGKMKGYSLKEQMRKSRYRKKMLEPISAAKPKLSNNIKDYLSVEKISMRDVEETFIANRIRMIRRKNKNMPSESTGQPLQMCQSEVALEPPK
jgi:hypothetical protein